MDLAGGIVDLSEEKAGEVVGVEAVAHLVSRAPEADIFEGATAEPGVQPETEDALIGATELAGACEDAAAVDPDGKLESGTVFEGELFGAQFGGAVEGDGGSGGEVFGKACGGDIWGESGVGIEGEGGVFHDHRQAGEWGDGVDAAGAEEGEARVMAFAVFEKLHRSEEIVFDDLTATGQAVHPGEDAGVGGGIDHPIGGWEGIDIAPGAEIGVENFDAESLEGATIEFASRADKVIETKDFEGGIVLAEVSGERTADEAAESRDENFH